MGFRPDQAERLAQDPPEPHPATDGSGPRAIGGSLRGLDTILEKPVRVARGATSIVYRATHRRLGRSVAVKVLDERHAGDAKIRKRFEREGTLLASLRDDTIVRILDRVETEDGRPALIMEWLDGVDVEKRLRTHGPLPYALALPIARDVAVALGAAHRSGILHRDVKPSNVVLLERAGGVRAVLLDFGIAAADHDPGPSTRTTLGTPAFMAPEQAHDAATVRAAADVYAVGALFYTMVVGEPPHGRGDATSQIDRIAEGYRASLVDAAPFVPRPVAELFDRCLSHDASRRPRDGDALLAALDDVLARPEVVEQATTSPTRALAIASVVVLGAGALGARMLDLAHEAKPILIATAIALALLSFAGFSLRERARFADAGFTGRLDRLVVEAAPRAAWATSFALVVAAWLDARGLVALDPTRVALAVGIATFALAIRDGARP